MVRQLVGLAGLTILAAGALVLLPSTSASASCDPAINNPLRTPNFNTDYRTGTIAQASSFGGVQAYIYNYSDYISHASPNEWENNANQSVLLVNGTSNSWAQIGELQYWNGSSKVHLVYVQLTINGTVAWTDLFSGADPYGSKSLFKVLFNPNGSPYYKWYWTSPDGNSSLLTTSSWDFTPNEAQMEVESHNQATQFPGSVAYPTSDAGGSMYLPAGGGGSWTTYSGDVTLNNAQGWMGNSPGAGTYTSDLQTWDADCPGS